MPVEQTTKDPKSSLYSLETFANKPSTDEYEAVATVTVDQIK